MPVTVLATTMTIVTMTKAGTKSTYQRNGDSMLKEYQNTMLSSALKRVRQEDQEFKASLDDIVSLRLA